MNDADKTRSEVLREALDESMRRNGDPQDRRDGRTGTMRENGGGSQAQKIVNILVAIMLGVFGWMGNTIWSIVQTQQQQLTQLNIELAKNYMPRVEMQQQLDRITTSLERIDQQTRRQQ